MFVGWLSFVMAVSVLREGIHAATAAAGLPRWESSIIVFLLALPLDLAISAGIESSLMGVRFGKGVEIWYTQRLIQLTLIAAVGADNLMIWVYGYAMAWFFLFCWPLSRLIGSLRRRMQGRHAAASA